MGDKKKLGDFQISQLTLLFLSFSLFFWFGARPGNSPSLLLTLHSGIVPRGPLGSQGWKPVSRIQVKCPSYYPMAPSLRKQLCLPVLYTNKKSQEAPKEPVFRAILLSF